MLIAVKGFATDAISRGTFAMVAATLIKLNGHKPLHCSATVNFAKVAMSSESPGRTHQNYLLGCHDCVAPHLQLLVLHLVARLLLLVHPASRDRVDLARAAHRGRRPRGAQGRVPLLPASPLRLRGFHDGTGLRGDKQTDKKREVASVMYNHLW